jgi:hypothetical protein
MFKLLVLVLTISVSYPTNKKMHSGRQPAVISNNQTGV